jgi:ribonuclease BN (tRNA processing enzyme)
MKTDLVEIFQTIRANLQPYTASGFTARLNTETEYDVWADKQIDVHGEKKDIVRFGSVTIESDHVAFCLSPLGEEPELKQVIHPELIQHLKDDSCFHFTQLDEEMVAKIYDALVVCFTNFKQKGWI